jgi:hypothetical protein
MLTLRGALCCLAIVAILPFMHACAAGASAGEMDVCLVKSFRTGAGGMRLPAWRPYLLFKDGTAYAEPKLAPDQMDLARSRQNEAERWGTWTKRAGGKTLSMPGHALMPTAQCVAPAAAGTSIQGSYKHVGGGGNTISGGHASFVHSDHYLFYSDGRFRCGSFSGLVSPGASAATHRASRTGHYRIEGYSIDLRYDDGGEAHLFFYADSEQLLHIGGDDYVPASE